MGGVFVLAMYGAQLLSSTPAGSTTIAITAVVAVFAATNAAKGMRKKLLSRRDLAVFMPREPSAGNPNES